MTQPDPRAAAHAKLLRSLGHSEAASIIEHLDEALGQPEAKPEQDRQPTPTTAEEARQLEGAQLLAQMQRDLGMEPAVEEPTR